MVLIQRIQDILKDNINKTIQEIMEDFIKLDENHWQEQILTISNNYKRIDGMIKGKWNFLKKESWCYGCLKPQNLRVVNLDYHAKHPLKYEKCLITTLWSCLLLVMIKGHYKEIWGQFTLHLIHFAMNFMKI